MPTRKTGSWPLKMRHMEIRLISWSDWSPWKNSCENDCRTLKMPISVKNWLKPTFWERIPKQNRNFCKKIGHFRKKIPKITAIMVKTDILTWKNDRIPKKNRNFRTKLAIFAQKCRYLCRFLVKLPIFAWKYYSGAILTAESLHFEAKTYYLTKSYGPYILTSYFQAKMLDFIGKISI